MKTIFITGSSAGIGVAGAQAFGKLGWKVILHGRSEEKARNLLSNVKSALPQGNFEAVWGDLADFVQVRALAAQVRALGSSLDILWNNAGMFTTEPRSSAQGFEYQWAVNHLGPFLLTKELLPTLKPTAGGKIIFTSSFAHRWGRIPGKNGFHLPGKYQGLSVYGDTKLANVLTALALRSRPEASGLESYAFHPGYVKTTIGANGQAGKGNANSFLRLFMVGPEEGADTALFLGTRSKASLPEGLYWSSRKPRKVNSLVTQENAESLWDLSERALGEL